MKDGQMETGMSDGSVPGPSWDPEPGRAYYSRPYWEYECHFGFPSYQFGEDYDLGEWQVHRYSLVDNAPSQVV